jgi:hypothetical protein
MKTRVGTEEVTAGTKAVTESPMKESTMLRRTMRGADTPMNAEVRTRMWAGTGTLREARGGMGSEIGARRAGLLALLTPALLLLPAVALDAQVTPIQERHPVQANARVEINALIHSITVERWDRNEVEVTGEYDAEWEEVVVRGDERSFRLTVEATRRNRNQRWSSLRSRELTVRAPEGVDLTVASVSGEVRVSGGSGPVSASSVSGSVRMQGGASSVRLNSVSGRVDYDGDATDIDAQAVSGSVSVRSSAPVSSGSVRSVSGRVEFNGALERGGRLSVETHSGSAELTLPRDTDARFSLSTFSGRVSSDLPGAEDEVHRRGQYVPQESLTFTVGSGAGRVEAKSFSGSVRIRPAGR